MMSPLIQQFHSHHHLLPFTVVLAPELIPTSPDNSTIHVNWTRVEHAVLYTLCIIREGSSSRLKVNTTDTAMTFQDLEAGTTYCIKGTAWDSEGRMGDDLTVCQITRTNHHKHGVSKIFHYTHST